MSEPLPRHLDDLAIRFEPAVADPRVTPTSRGSVSCAICGHKIPWDKAFWIEKLQNGMILYSVAAHALCLNGHTPEQIEQKIADRAVRDIFLPRDERLRIEGTQ